MRFLRRRAMLRIAAAAKNLKRKQSPPPAMGAEYSANIARGRR
jgi:hypothetical protein